jgi:transcriptional regulator with XRE-family HTH domain
MAHLKLGRTVDTIALCDQDCGMAQQSERPATLSKLVGKQVKLQLFLKEMSGRDLAVRLGVSPSWVSYRLSGKQEIGLDDLFQIATVLGVDLDELLTADVKAKATETGEGAKRDFDQAPAERAATIGHPCVDLPVRVSHVPRRRRTPRPFSRPKPGPVRPVSAVPARTRRPQPVRPGIRRKAE